MPPTNYILPNSQHLTKQMSGKAHKENALKNDRQFGFTKRTSKTNSVDPSTVPFVLKVSFISGLDNMGLVGGILSQTTIHRQDHKGFFCMGQRNTVILATQITDRRYYL